MGWEWACQPTDAPNPCTACVWDWPCLRLSSIKVQPIERLRDLLPLLVAYRVRRFRSEGEREREGGRERAAGARTELANESLGESVEDRNKWQALALYEALNARDVDRVQQLLAPDIEWWFHGPPEHQHMMRMLTGADDDTAAEFRFFPQRVAAFGSTVVAEGTGPGAATWVHAWTVSTDGIITQVREYFNTSVTVTRVAADSPPKPKDSPRPTHWPPVWQSSSRKSFPALVLAI